MKIFLALALAAVISSAYGLNCYTCNSKEDPTCLDNPSGSKDCGHVIADLSSTRFRCMTIHGKADDGEFVLRRCSVNNECSFQVENKRFSWDGKSYENSKCDECTSDNCNKEKLL